MQPIQQSVVWWCFHRGGVDAETLIKKSAEIGYASVEMASQEYWGLIRKHGMKIAIVSGHGTLTDGLNKRANHDRIEDQINQKIELAVQYEIPSLICFSGNRNGLPDDEGIDITAEGLQRVVKVAEDAGITLCIELLNSKVNHPDYQCDHTDWGVAVCKKLGSPAVKLLYDIYHMQIMEGDLIRTIRDNLDYIGHFHTAGNPGRNDMDETQEIYYPPIMCAIAEGNYTGYVGHEFIPKGDPFTALQQAYDLCRAD